MSEYRGKEFWFVDSNGGVCFCEDCTKQQRPETVVPQYVQQGLPMVHGMKVSLMHCKKANEIAGRRLEVIHQPAIDNDNDKCLFIVG